MLSKRKRVLGMVIAAAVLVQAGSAATASISAKAVDACKLATKVEIEDILGVNLADPLLDAPTLCQFDVSGALVTIATAKYTKAVKKDFAVNSKQPGAEKIPGLKRAYAVDSTRVLRADAIKGKKSLTVTVTAGGSEIGFPFDEFIEITRTAFKRL